MIDLWWPVNEIIPTKVQLAWILPYLLEVSDGSWPPEPDLYLTTHHKHWTVKHRSSYIRNGKHRVKRRARFENISILLAEIDIRLDKCGIDGQLVKPYFLGERHSPDWAERRSLKVIGYISGKWPKTFEDGTIKSYLEYRKH